MKDSTDGYNVYRGLQKPLIFKSFKGKFIYWAMGSVLAAFVVGILVSTLVKPIAGVAAMIVISLGGLLFTNQKQKKGLHKKKISLGTFVVSPKFKRSSKG
ncbi:DUF4133 domain-containing protein [Rufibacter sp. XAAS-G3-1]|uniref:DUF4133 domain-containing protein n=1 Tax=Rufibacter sp. XAAS-G3-1 TaxID=2729134 RepID=UPI0015E720D9|nr:DUF4133 domain-containing protein [Rufibacter sp. XAAS-G3-1]